MPEKKPWLSSLTWVGSEINSAIANGHVDTFSFEEIYSSLEKGTLIEDLNVRLPGVFDFRLYPPGSDQCLALNSVLNDVAYGLRGKENMKVGIEKSGLHLLLAFVLEALKQQLWENPSCD